MSKYNFDECYNSKLVQDKLVGLSEEQKDELKARTMEVQDELLHEHLYAIITDSFLRVGLSKLSEFCAYIKDLPVDALGFQKGSLIRHLSLLPEESRGHYVSSMNKLYAIKAPDLLYVEVSSRFCFLSDSEIDSKVGSITSSENPTLELGRTLCELNTRILAGEFAEINCEDA